MVDTFTHVCAFCGRVTIGPLDPPNDVETMGRDELIDERARLVAELERLGATNHEHLRPAPGYVGPCPLPGCLGTIG